MSVCPSTIFLAQDELFTFGLTWQQLRAQKSEATSAPAKPPCLRAQPSRRLLAAPFAPITTASDSKAGQKNRMCFPTLAYTIAY